MSLSKALRAVVSPRRKQSTGRGRVRRVGRLSVEPLEDRAVPAATAALVKDLNLSPFSSFPSQPVNVNGTLFFTADDGDHGTEVWKSDGTAAGTALVRDIVPGFDGSFPEYLTAVGGTLYFVASTPETGPELWKSDGTEAGTVLVKDINPGAGYYGGGAGSNPAN